jgi:hypothetical protein
MPFRAKFRLGGVGEIATASALQRLSPPECEEDHGFPQMRVAAMQAGPSVWEKSQEGVVCFAAKKREPLCST